MSKARSLKKSIKLDPASFRRVVESETRRIVDEAFEDVPDDRLSPMSTIESMQSTLWELQERLADDPAYSAAFFRALDKVDAALDDAMRALEGGHAAPVNW